MYYVPCSMQHIMVRKCLFYYLS